MEIEKAIQFLTDSAAGHDARLAAIQSNLLTLTKVVKALADNQAELQREMRERDAQSRERDAKLDDRVAKLVSAIMSRGLGHASEPPTQ